MLDARRRQLFLNLCVLCEFFASFAVNGAVRNTDLRVNAHVTLTAKGREGKTPLRSRVAEPQPRRIIRTQNLMPRPTGGAMKLMNPNPKTLVTLTTMAAAAVWVAGARAQQPSSSDQIQTLMTHRQEMSNRAMEEPSRRRFEEGKSDTKFPSDANSNTKGGVVRALTPDQQNALRHNDRGLDLFSKGKLEAAIKEYQEAIRLDAKLAAAHNNLGGAYFAAGRFEEALNAFGQACETDPEYGQAFFNLALTHIKLGHEKEANAALDGALHAYNSSGEAHLKAGRYKEAEEAFQGMLQIDPNYAPAFVGLAMVYNAAGRYEDAATAADRVLKQFPNSVDAHYDAGIANASLGKREAALEHLARLQQLNAKDLAEKLSELINKKAPAK